MKVLLVVSPYKFPTARVNRTELLGILYLAATLRQHGHTVRIYDPTLGPPTRQEDGLYYFGASQEDIAAQCTSFDPDMAGVSCHYGFGRQDAYRTFATIKRASPGATTVMGGLVPSVYKAAVLAECPAIDYALIGESEQSFSELVSSIGDGAPVTGIDGLIYRDGGSIVANEKKSFIKDLDSLPYPARDLVDIQAYMNAGTRLYGLGNRPCLSLLTSRSCPYGCSFCNMWMVHGVGWRARSVDNIMGELDEALHKYHAEHIYIMDDNFTFKVDRAKEICAEIIRRGYRFRWNTPNGISVRGMDAELATLMKKAGCASACLGIESGSEYVRNVVIRKHVSNEQIAHAVQCLHDAKIPVGGYFVLGMPGETEKHFKETVRFARKLPLSFVIASYAIPYPGTRLYDELVRREIIEEGFQVRTDTLSDPVFATEEFTTAELVKRKKRFFASFYFSHFPSIAWELMTGRCCWLNFDTVMQLFHNTLMRRRQS